MHSRIARSKRHIMAVTSCMMVIGAILCPPNWTKAAGIPYSDPIVTTAPIASSAFSELTSNVLKFNITSVTMMNAIRESINQKLTIADEKMNKGTVDPIEETVMETTTEETVETITVESASTEVTTPTEEVTPEVGAEEPAIEPAAPQYDYSAIPLSQSELQSVIDGSVRTGIPIPVILGVIENESGFVSTARNAGSGCYGYMQLHPRYFPSNLSPEDNITYGINYLGENFSICGGDIVKALDMYHCGHVTGDTYYPNRILEKAAHWSEVTGIPM